MKETITVNFILPDDSIKSVEANEGESVLQVANFHGIPLDGACGGSLACATCHVIVEKKWFSNMQISDEENDMLDLAFGLKETSRLACQIILTKEMDGIEVTIPENNLNFCACCE